MKHHPIMRLPNGRPASEPPQRDMAGLILRIDGRAVIGGYDPFCTDGFAWNPYKSDGYLETVDEWCYLSDLLIQHHISRGCVLPNGWFQIDELTVETVIEYHDRPLHLMFLVDYIDEDGIDHSGTVRTLSDLHELILRINRISGLIEVTVDVGVRQILDALQEDDSGFIAYRIAQPLGRAQ